MVEEEEEDEEDVSLEAIGLLVAELEEEDEEDGLEDIFVLLHAAKEASMTRERTIACFFIFFPFYDWLDSHVFSLV